MKTETTPLPVPPNAATQAERFTRLAWPQLPALLRVARLLARDEHAAEDLVQETMMRACRHIESFEPGTNMRAWLMTILRRVWIDAHRREGRRVEAGSLEALAHEPAAPSTPAAPAWQAPEDLLERFSDETVESALRALPESMRWTLLLVDVQQMAMDEAAEVLAVAPGTIKSRASRARAQLRELLWPEAVRRGWVTTGKEA